MKMKRIGMWVAAILLATNVLAGCGTDKTMDDIKNKVHL